MTALHFEYNETTGTREVVKKFKSLFPELRLKDVLIDRDEKTKQLFAKVIADGSSKKDSTIAENVRVTRLK
jgi:hypothetical protein